ncbi:hypothetical protein [Methylorubrum extorquens]|uniref:hypothetical protein n=1 Tax=Methylorubrum extorquens TaxID=408 RepID=UPI001EE5B453|nr:hypothetical protein [Methylorubrum extorquens]MCG5249521.1 hypothetical protein [Methylorubrum extorquens]
MQLQDFPVATRREQLAALELYVLRLACAGHVHGLDANAVAEAVRAVRNALPAVPPTGPA